MTNEVVKSIRRIVRDFPDDPLGLDAAEDRRDIPTSRGVGFINTRGDVTGSGVEGDGSNEEDQPVTPAPPTDDASDNDTGAKGKTTDEGEALGGVDQEGGVNDVYNAVKIGDVIGETAGTDPDNGGQTTRVNGTPLDDALQYRPPLNWSDPETPAPHLENDPSAYASCASAFGGVASDYEGHGTWNTGGARRCFTSAGFAGVVSASAPPISCTDMGGVPDLGGFCDSTPDALWPIDNECIIAWNTSDEKFLANLRDFDCTGTQQTTGATVQRLEQGGNRYEYTRVGDVTKITKIDSSNVPVPLSDVIILDADGRVIDVVKVEDTDRY